MREEGCKPACGTIEAMKAEAKTLGAYIQVPFCQTKCTYCNFHTGVVSRERYAPYAAAVCREIAETARAADILGERAAGIDTVYFGGGTPSLLEASALENVMDALQRNFGLAPVLDGEPEITLEADPETITREKALAWIAAGFNRVSLGVQSFSDPELKASGRMHRRADIFAAVEMLRGAGFQNISMDLIAGLAHQTKESWEQSLAQLVAIRPEHVSIYMLEIDEGSHLGKESLAGGSRYGAGTIPSDDAIADSYERSREKLRSAGYEHYEISNWGLPGFRSRHNLKYWRREPYLGFGAGAHSFSGKQRWANAHDAAAYVAAIGGGKLPVEQLESVTRESALEEELFLGLRKLDGIDVAQIEREYGVAVEPRFERLMSAGLVEREGSWVRLAPGKLSVANEVFVELMK